MSRNEQIWKEKSIDPSPRIVSYLLLTFNDQYKHHFQKEINLNFFGQEGSRNWTTKWAAYQKSVFELVAAESRKQFDSTGEKWTVAEKTTWDCLPTKLEAFFADNDDLAGFPFAPRVHGNTPLLCAFFVEDLMELLFQVESGLHLVSI